MSMSMSRRMTAEFLGTFWLVFGGCGSAVLAGGQIGLVGISLAFGLTVLTMAYAIGRVSGCHLNPAVSIGLVVAGRWKASDLPGYIVAQVAGAIAAAALLRGYSETSDLAANGFATHSPAHHTVGAAFATEFLLTFFFLFIILGVTHKRAPVGFAPLAVGLALTLIHLIGIPVTNLSVNPARSTGPAVLVGGWALEQLWLFWVAPIAGAVAAGFVTKFIDAGDADAAPAS